MMLPPLPAVADGQRVYSNSTWIAEDTPCITYGLRGVVHCKVEVSAQCAFQSSDNVTARRCGTTGRTSIREWRVARRGSLCSTCEACLSLVQELCSPRGATGSSCLAPSRTTPTGSPSPDSVRFSRTDHAKNPTHIAFRALPDNSVRPLTEEERQLYKVLSSVTQTPASLLSARWREPSLTVHNVEVSGPRSQCLVPFH